MRCPECNQRNSVAARVCTSCGIKLKRKPLPLGVKLVSGLCASLILVWGVASAVVPSLTDPEQALERLGKKMARGPKSPKHADEMRSEFDKLVRAYLYKFGTLPGSQLRACLQRVLPSTPFEVHVFDFPRGLKLVEIDTVLQPSDYLVIESLVGGQSKRVNVYPINGLEVFDAGQIINDRTGPVFVTIGHSGGQTPRRPQVKVLALLGDEMADHSSHAVPPILGEGTASFAPNKRDVHMDLSLYSVGVSEGLFADVSGSLPPIEDETIRRILIWKDGHYIDRFKLGKSQLAALYAVARCMYQPEEKKKYSAYLGNEGINLVEIAKLKPDQKAPHFVIRRIQTGATNKPARRSRETDKRFFLLSGTNGTFQIQLTKVNKHDRSPVLWMVSSAKPLDQIDQNATQATAKPGQDEHGKGDIVSSTTLKPMATQQENELSKANNNLNLQQNRKQLQRQDIKNYPGGTDTSYKAREGSIQERTENTQKKNKELERKENTADKTTENKTSSGDVKEKARTLEGNKPVLLEGTTADIIKIRRRPGTEYRTVTEIPKGSGLKIIGKENGWYKVTVNGKTGFVYAGLIDCKKSDAYTTATITKSKSIKDENHQDVYQAHPGERFVILGGVKNDKYKVQFANGKTGYIEKDAVDVAVDVPQQVP